MSCRTRLFAQFGLFGLIGYGAGCIDGTGEPTPRPGIERVAIVASDSALLAGHNLQFGVLAWDSAGDPVSGPHVAWRTDYPQWLLVDSTGLVTASSNAPSSLFHVYVTAIPEGMADTFLLRVHVPGDLKWRLPLGAAPIEGGPAEGPDGTVYVLGQVDINLLEATLFAVSPKGQIRWQRRLTQVDGTNYPLVGLDGVVYVVGQHVWAFNPDGTLRWSLTTRPVENYANIPSSHAGAISADGVLFAEMAYDLFAFRASNGDTLWQGPRAQDAGWLLPPSVSFDGRTAYIKNTADSLYAFDAVSGTIRWTVPDPTDTSNPDRISFGAGPAVADGQIYIPAAFQLMGLDTTGTITGVTADMGRGVSEPAVEANGTALIQVPHTYGLRAFRPVANQLWEALGYRSRWTWYGGPALGQERVLYVAATDAFYALQLSDTGVTVRWRFPSNTSTNLIFEGAPLIGADGTVYTFTSCDNGQQTGPCSDELFAFWADLPPEPTSPWPMWRHDARRSGQAGP